MAVLVLFATMLVTLRLARARIAALAAAVLVGTAGASPFIEAFTLSGELLASLPAVLSLLAFTFYLGRRQLRWLALAGLLTGCAVLVKQSAFDAGLAAVAFLLWRERLRGLRPAAVLSAFALAPVAVAAAAAANLGDWWYAVVGYRGEGDSLLTGSAAHRVHRFWDSLPHVAYALGLLALLAALGWRRAPLLARLWLGAAALGVIGGGNFHEHYYVQLVPPLALLGGVGAERLIRSARLTARLPAAAAAVATLAVTAPLWFASPTAQAREIWPRDPHLLHDGAVAAYVRSHTRPGDRIFVVWAAANLYYLTDRDPAVQYMWRRPLQAIDGALPAARRVLAQRPPALVIEVQTPDSLDRSGATRRILRRDYRRVGTVDGVPVYRPRSR